MLSISNQNKDKLSVEFYKAKHVDLQEDARPSIITLMQVDNNEHDENEAKYINLEGYDCQNRKKVRS